jgi:hypothetical protein
MGVGEMVVVVWMGFEKVEKLEQMMKMLTGLIMVRRDFVMMVERGLGDGQLCCDGRMLKMVRMRLRLGNCVG